MMKKLKILVQLGTKLNFYWNLFKDVVESSQICYVTISFADKNIMKIFKIKLLSF